MNHLFFLKNNESSHSSAASHNGLWIRTDLRSYHHLEQIASLLGLSTSICNLEIVPNSSWGCYEKADNFGGAAHTVLNIIKLAMEVLSCWIKDATIF